MHLIRRGDSCAAGIKLNFRRRQGMSLVFYSSRGAPNPRRVEVFMAEHGLLEGDVSRSALLAPTPSLPANWQHWPANSTLHAQQHAAASAVDLVAAAAPPRFLSLTAYVRVYRTTRLWISR